MYLTGLLADAQAGSSTIIAGIVVTAYVMIRLIILNRKNGVSGKKEDIVDK